MRNRTLLLLLLLALCSAAVPSTAQAGVYTVRACADDNGAADGWVPAGGQIACPWSLSGRPGIGIYGNYATAYQDGRVILTAPPGTSIARMQGQVDITDVNGWRGGVYDFANGRWLYCGPANACNSFGNFADFAFDSFRTTQLGAMLVCARAECTGPGKVFFRNLTVFIEDFTLPDVAVDVPQGWVRGTVPVGVTANDNVGIRTTQLFTDGIRRDAVPRTCSEHRLVSCPNGRSAFSLNTAEGLTDGQHRLTVDATDSAGNSASRQATISIDNTAPGQMETLAVEDGDGWRAANAFAAAFTPPASSGGAPVVALQFELCPSAKPSGDPSCQRGERPAAEFKKAANSDRTVEVEGLKVPAAGEWTGRFWLRDAAGNQSIETARSVPLRFDDQPPALAFRPLAAEDPTRLSVRAADEPSGVASGAIELQRRGESTWRSLATQLDDGGFNASLDDENLPDGAYLVRARAVDRAGNERSTSLLEDGRSAELALPVRVKTRLVAGKARRVRIARRPKGSKRRYRTRLVSRPEVGYGRSVRLHGRLTTPGANPVTKTEVQVIEQVATPGSPVRQIGTVVTSRTGRFSFRVPAGPSRAIRFRYGGTPTVRPATAEVELGVRAASSFSVSRSRLVNGQSVTFRGRLRGGYLPAQGKLVALQAFSRGRWRPFATTRAAATTGRWSYDYRFDGTRGQVRYRFRVRVLREATYPFNTGSSRQRRIVVRGI